MSSEFIPLCAFDVTDDGQATPAPDTDPAPGPGATYRWFHCDLSDPGIEDWVTRELPGISGQTLLAAETRPRIEQLGDGLILSLRGVNLNEGAEVEDMVSVRVWATAKLIITVRKRRIFAVDDIRKAAENGRAPGNVADFLDVLSDGLIDRIETVSLDLDFRTDEMETAVYDNHQTHLPMLATLRRRVIKLRRYIGPQLDALTALARIDSPVISRRAKPRLLENANRAARSFEEMNEVRERLTTLSDHLDLTQTARLGKNSFTLSVVAAIFLPISFLSGLLGVNLGGIPGAQSPWGFWIFVGILALLGVICYLIVRLRRWL